MLLPDTVILPIIWLHACRPATSHRCKLAGIPCLYGCSAQAVTTQIFPVISPLRYR